MNTFQLDYRQIETPKKGFPALFADYASESERRPELISAAFSLDCLHEADYYRQLGVLAGREFDRPALVSLLLRQNSRFGGGEVQRREIEKLRSPRCVAVVTGQQPGLFTGPLYTVYKALGAIVFAEQQQRLFPEYQFVPLFWIEGEDHDYDESAHASVVAGNRLVDVREEPYRVLPDQMVGSCAFGPGIAETVNRFVELLPDSPHRERVAEIIRECYAPGMTFEIGFASMMLRLFEGMPLVMLSSQDPEFKRLSAPVFMRELMTAPASSYAVVAQSSRLELLGYPAQAKPRTVNLYYVNQHGQRQKIEQHGDGLFSMVPDRQRYSRHQMVELASDHPERFSPNVILRPIVQDSVLPTFATIAGPGEVGYLAQCRGAYEHFGLSMPFVVPRGSFTLVEPRVGRLMERLVQVSGRAGVSRRHIYQAVFRDLPQLRRNAVGIAENPMLEGLFAETRNRVRMALEELAPVLSKIDPTLDPLLGASTAQAEKLVRHLEEKAWKASRRKHEELLEQISRAEMALFPDGLPQERVVNVAWFLCREGLGLIKTLKGLLESYSNESHVIVEL